MTQEIDFDTLSEEYQDNGFEHDDLEHVQQGKWVDSYKYQTCTTVYRHKPSGRFVAAKLMRSGSYWSGYEYDNVVMHEVWPVSKTVIEYTTTKPD